MDPRPLFRLVWILALVVGCSGQPGSHAQHGGPAPTGAVTPVLFDDLGTYHRAITTASPRACSTRVGTATVGSTPVTSISPMSSVNCRAIRGVAVDRS